MTFEMYDYRSADENSKCQPSQITANSLLEAAQKVNDEFPGLGKFMYLWHNEDENGFVDEILAR